MAPELRPLVPADADAVFDLQVRAFTDLERRLGQPESPPPKDRTIGLRRIAHLATTDPGGAWVSVAEDGTVTGASLALVREGLWGLSLLVVDPGRQSAGAGRALLEASLAHANGARGGIILASEDARALRAYSRAGFALRPVLDATGRVTVRPTASGAVRPVSWPADQEVVDAASRHVRGASHAVDVPVYLRNGLEVLVHPDGGWAVHDHGTVKVVAATTEPIAEDLLRTVLAGVAEARVEFIDAGNDWAFRVVLDAGLHLRPSGAVCTRGDVGPLAPYIPSGAYL